MPKQRQRLENVIFLSDLVKLFHLAMNSINNFPFEVVSSIFFYIWASVTSPSQHSGSAKLITGWAVHTSYGGVCYEGGAYCFVISSATTLAHTNLFSLQPTQKISLDWPRTRHVTFSSLSSTNLGFNVVFTSTEHLKTGPAFTSPALHIQLVYLFVPCDTHVQLALKKISPLSLCFLLHLNCAGRFFFTLSNHVTPKTKHPYKLKTLHKYFICIKGLYSLIYFHFLFTLLTPILKVTVYQLLEGAHPYSQVLSWLHYWSTFGDH